MMQLDMNKVTGVTKNSNLVKPGYVYFCFIGNKDGHDYAVDAINLGASYIIGTRDLNLKNYIKVDDVDIALGKISSKFYGLENTKMSFVGVTGTDGKTSVTSLVDQILNNFSKSAYLGTSGLMINNELEFYGSMTTPFADSLYSYIQTANEVCDYFTMEVSSHGLKQKRIAEMNFDVIGFTNFTSDHLDYHLTMQDYYESKLKLFDYLKPNGFAIINGDDEKLKIISDSRISFIGQSNEFEYYFTNIITSLEGIKFDLIVSDKKYEISSPLLANFNVYNLVMAIAIVHKMGYELEAIINITKTIKVAGRLELYKFDNTADVILDFAHTDDSIEKVMKFVDSNKNNQNLWVITGSAGDRDVTKRPLMGRAASDLSDVLILTEDDPRHEKVQDISNQIASGVRNSNCELLLIDNRRDAIKYALENSEKEDIVVILGKSGQDVMYYDGYTEPYIEANVVRDIVKEINEGY